MDIEYPGTSRAFVQDEKRESGKPGKGDSKYLSGRNQFRFWTRSFLEGLDDIGPEGTGICALANC